MATVSPDAMDAEFLKRTVGNPLSAALTSLVMAQPSDPIEFIGEALLDYVQRREHEEKRNQHAAEMEHRLKAFHVEQNAVDMERNAEQEAAATKAKAEQDVESAISAAARHDEVYAKVIGLLQERLGAAGVQLGRKIMVDEREVVEFVAASKSREDMIGQELKGLKEGEEAEEGETTEEGVTFDVWKKTEPPPPVEPVYDEDGELVPDESEPELIPPEHVLVENVVRNPRVKFFGIPKLGSYLAVPITYDSWLRPGGILIAPADVQATQPQGEDGEDEPEAEAEGGAGDEGPEETVEGEEDMKPRTPTSVYRKSTFPVQLVLCMDTLGQGRCFRPREIKWVKEWAAKLVAAVEALEARMFDEEAALLPTLRGADKMEELSSILSPEMEEAAIAEAVADFETASDEEKEKAKKTATYRHKLKPIELLADLVGAMGKLHLAPSPSAVLTVLEQALALVGKARVDLCNARGSVDWAGKMRVVVSAELVTSIAAFDPEDTAAAPRAAEAKEIVESIDGEIVKDVNLPTWVILGWLLTAINATEEAAAGAAAAAEAAAAAAEVAAAEAAAAAEVAAAAAEEEGEGGDEAES